MTTYSTYTDQELTSLLNKEDKQAYAEIFKRYNSLLIVHAYGKLRDKEAAKDLVQDVFAKLWMQRTSLNISSSLSAFLFTTVRNAVLNVVKHQKVITNYAESFFRTAERTQVSADHLIRERQFAAMIETEINALPPRMRTAFELRRHEHLSNKEIAERMGTTEATAADQLTKANKILRSRLGVILVIAFTLLDR